MRTSSEALIEASAEDVFSLVSDPERWSLFVPSLAENRNAYPADRCVGQSWDSEFSLDGVPLAVVGWCTVFEPPERYGIRTKGAIASDWLYTIEPEGDGSRLRVEVECDPATAGGPDSALLAAAICDDAERGAQNLKELLDE